MKQTAALLLTLLLAAPNAYSVDWNWAKNSSGSKTKLKKYQKTTNVAAVRGVEEPGDIDPDARDMEGVAWMEAQKVPAEKGIQFIIDGKLKIRDGAAEKEKPDLAAAASDLASGLGALAGRDKLAKAMRQLTPEEEAEIGRDVAANVIAQFGLVKDPALNEYVNQVGLAVARSSPRKEVAWRFAILNSDIVNAFAAPGGYIFITKGLLKSLNNEAELACVLGHEIVHVSDRHVVKEIQRSKMLAAAIPDYANASAEKAKWMQQVSNFAVSLMWKGLSREDELSADAKGALLAYNTGYDPKAFRDVLNTLKAQSQNASSKKELKFLLSTHPKPEDRMAAFEAKSAELPSGGEKLAERFKKSVAG